MKRFAWTVVVVLVVVGAVAAAPALQVGESVSPIQVQHLHKHAAGVDISLRVDQPTWRTVETDAGEVQMAEFTTAALREEYGAPAVPVVGRMVRVPNTGGVELVVTGSEFELIEDVNYAAWLGEDVSGTELGTLSGLEDAWYPQEIVQISEPAIFRDFRVVTLATNPVQVNPARGQVRVYSDIELSLQYTAGDGVNELHRQPTALSELFIPFYRDMLDWETNELDDYQIMPGKVQVVTKNSALPVLADWVEWKEKKGWTLEFLTESDASWNANSIRNELIDRYQSMEDPFDYIVVIGDASGSYATPGAEYYGDHMYGCLDGDDWLQEATVGRISVESTADLVEYTTRAITYESEPYMDETDWFTHGVVACGSNYSGLSTILLNRYARHRMLEIGYTQVDTAWYNDGQGDVNSRVVDFLSEGASIYSYRGYLGTGLSCGEINSVNNVWKLPFVIDITCATGTWSSGTSQTECWVRAGTVNSPKGGIGSIGTATAGTHTRYNNSLSGGALNSVLVQRQPSMGAAILGAKLNLYQNYMPYASGSVDSFNEWCNLMGDPTLWVYTAVPQGLALETPGNFQPGMNDFTVTVTRATGGNAVENAWVTFHKSDENEELLIHGRTNAQGVARLTVPLRHAGEATLTVTAQNYEPVVEEYVFGESSLVGISDYEVVDDNSGGTLGNGNGVPEAGETIGLRLTAHNYGEQEATGVEAEVASEDVWVDVIASSATFDPVPAGDEVTSEDLVLVEIQPGIYNQWMVDLEMEITSGAETLEDGLHLAVGAPLFQVTEVQDDDELLPGQQGSIHLRVENRGDMDAAAGTAYLTPIDPYLGVVEGQVPIISLDVGDNSLIGPFVVQPHEESLRGYPAVAQLVIVDADGVTDTTQTVIHLGEKRDEDPDGPDGYGYFAYDDRDTDYDLAPEFDWIEINPSASGNDYEGEELNISDYGEEGDDADLVQLPFEVQYYGRHFTEMTVCSNGWVAFGDQQDLPLGRNWSIPSPLGPNNMIAVYWDDRTTGGNGGVYYYHDAPNDRFIVEWYSLPDLYGSNNCTFQLIVYDQVEGHFTTSGDNEFVFQYDELNHSTGPGWDNDYYTVGIENQDQTDGLQLVYWNSPNDMAVEGRAIRFTTMSELITGTVSGTVTALDGGDPLEGMTVRTQDYVFVTETQADGSYELEEVVIGQHHIVVEGRGINSAVEYNVDVYEDETTNVDFQVTMPGFEVDPAEISVEVEQLNQFSVPVTLSNPGDGPVAFTVDINPAGPEAATGGELDEWWDLMGGFNTDPVETRNRGVCLDYEHIWVAGADNASVDNNKMYKYNHEGELLATYDQPVENPSSAGFYALCFDGEYLYGVDNGIIHQMEETEAGLTLVDSWQAPANPARFLTYDPINDFFWMGDMTTNIKAIDRSGNLVRSFEHSLSLQAISFYREDDSDYNLYLFSQGVTDDQFYIHRMSSANGNMQFVDAVNIDGYLISDTDITFSWDANYWTLVTMLDGGLNADLLNVYEMSVNNSWIQTDLHQGFIEPGESTTINVTFFGLSFPEGNYSNYLEFEHDAWAQTTYLPVEMSVLLNDLPGEGSGEEQPLEWAFQGVYPNPFNPVTRLEFSLREPSEVDVRLFNLLGQQVMHLSPGMMRAGQHQMQIRAGDMASGIYFLRFQAGPIQETRKLVLMK